MRLPMKKRSATLETTAATTQPHHAWTMWPAPKLSVGDGAGASGAESVVTTAAMRRGGGEAEGAVAAFVEPPCALDGTASVAGGVTGGVSSMAGELSAGGDSEAEADVAAGGTDDESTGAATTAGSTGTDEGAGGGRVLALPGGAADPAAAGNVGTHDVVGIARYLAPS
jgi:hypothetical protein